MFERLCYYRSLVDPLQRLAHIHHLLQGLSGIRKKRNLIKECFFEKASTRARKHRQHQTTRKHANTQTRTLNQSPHKQACANSIPTHTFENNGTTFHAQSAHAHDKQQVIQHTNTHMSRRFIKTMVLSYNSPRACPVPPSAAHSTPHITRMHTRKHTGHVSSRSKMQQCFPHARLRAAAAYNPGACQVLLSAAHVTTEGTCTDAVWAES